MTDFATLNSWVGGYEWPRPDLTSNHGYGDSGLISGTTSANFRTTNHGLKYKNLNSGLWERVKIEIGQLEVRKFGGGSAKIKDDMVVTF